MLSLPPHVHALSSSTFWFPVPAVLAASPTSLPPAFLSAALALVTPGVAPAFCVAVLLLPLSVGAPECPLCAPTPVPPACPRASFERGGGGGGFEGGGRGGGLASAPPPLSLHTKMYHSSFFSFWCWGFVVKTSESACLFASSMSCLRRGKGWVMRREAVFRAAFHASFLAGPFLKS